MYNKIALIGNLGRDAELSYTSSGTALLRFSMAVKSGYGDNEKTAWVSCTLFGARAEALTDHMVKGKLVYVEGELYPADDGNPRMYDKNDGSRASTYEVTVKEVKLLK
jgi:single-strand DNA-binding protein